MAQIRIPSHQKKALEAFVALPKESTEALLLALQRVKPTLSPRQLARQVASQVKVPVSDIQEILQLIASLEIVAHTSRRPKEAVAADVAKAISDEQLTGKELTSDEVDSLKSKLLSFLELQILEITAKAADVLLQHKTIFVSSRVITDVRPIFSEEELSPLAAVLIHNLEIQAYTDGNHASYFAAMDSTDLMQLRDVIDRAIKKEAALRKTIDQSGLSYIEPDPGV